MKLLENGVILHTHTNTHTHTHRPEVDRGATYQTKTNKELGSKTLIS